MPCRGRRIRRLWSVGRRRKCVDGIAEAGSSRCGMRISNVIHMSVLTHHGTRRRATQGTQHNAFASLYGPISAAAVNGREGSWSVPVSVSVSVGLTCS